MKGGLMTAQKEERCTTRKMNTGGANTHTRSSKYGCPVTAGMVSGVYAWKSASRYLNNAIQNISTHVSQGT
jgi:hypothetical protein